MLVCMEISNFIPLILDMSFVLFILLETLICKSSEAYIFPSLKNSWPASLWMTPLSLVLLLDPCCSFSFSLSSPDFYVFHLCISLCFILVTSAVLSHGLRVPLELLLIGCLTHTVHFNFNDFSPISKSCTLLSQICVVLNAASCSFLIFPVLLFVFHMLVLLSVTSHCVIWSSQACSIAVYFVCW